MQAPNYIYDGSYDWTIDDIDGGTDFLQFEVPSSVFTPSLDQPTYFTGVSWAGNDLTFSLATGYSVTLTDQTGAGQIETLNLGQFNPFVYDFAGKENGTGGNDWIARETGGTTYARGGDDIVFGSSDSDIIFGGAGFDIVFGFDGNDTIRGGAGRLSADGGAGNDEIYGNSDPDWIHGGTGDDLIKGFSGQDQLYGGAGRDTIRGGGDNDLILGENGNDRLFGDSGADVLVGGVGADKLKGGAGGDLFVFDDDTYTGVDTVRDFDLLEGDRLDVSALTAVYDNNTDDLNDFIRFTDNGRHSFLQIDADGGADSFVTVAKVIDELGLDAGQMVIDGDLVL